MAKNITASGLQAIVNDCNRVLITVNAALTGTIVVSTATGGTVATITNPTVGSSFTYGGLTGQGTLNVNPSTTTDITITVDPR